MLAPLSKGVVGEGEEGLNPGSELSSSRVHVLKKEVKLKSPFGLALIVIPVCSSQLS